MINKFISAFILSVFLLFRSGISSLAIDNVHNINKFGIHINNTTDLDKAAELVNSNGGDWGFITVVIQENDQDTDKWQNFFNQCRKLHLVPIVRVATYPENGWWSKPKIQQVEKWYSFFDDLIWPVSDRYIVVYNEPNHDKEWGGNANPKEYAKILDRFLTVFSQNPKFKILNAGVDLAAPNGNTTYEAFKFLGEVNFEVPGIFNRLSGWSSHSYPNHGFLGKPNEYKKTSIRGYQFELDYLKKYLGVSRDLPVFLTETGWPYEICNPPAGGAKIKKNICPNKYYSPDQAAEYIKTAFEEYWLKDPRVVAVTPFTLNYPYEPFIEFSWMDQQGSPSAQYLTVQSIPKISWQPTQEEKVYLQVISPPNFIPANEKYNGLVRLENLGESILYDNENFTFIKGVSSPEIKISDIVVNRRIEPGESFYFEYTLTSLSSLGDFSFGWQDNENRLRVIPDTLVNTVRYSFWQNVYIRLSRLVLQDYNN